MPFIQIKVNDALYLKDPAHTELGRRMVTAGTELIAELGIENFTFKKLAERIESTEASVYRYFENKHMMLHYLLSWYWRWQGFRIEYQTNNLRDPRHKLETVIDVLTDTVQDDPAVGYVNSAALFQIMVVESAKAYFSRSVTPKMRKALFKGYEELVERISGIVKEINPRYKQPKALVSTLILSVQRQTFYAMHVTSLTELRIKRQSNKEIAAFIKRLVFASLDARAGRKSARSGK